MQILCFSIQTHNCCSNFVQALAKDLPWRLKEPHVLEIIEAVGACPYKLSFPCYASLYIVLLWYASRIHVQTVSASQLNTSSGRKWYTVWVWNTSCLSSRDVPTILVASRQFGTWDALGQSRWTDLDIFFSFYSC